MKYKGKLTLGFTDSNDYQEHIKKSNEADNKKNRIQGVELDLTKPYRYWQLLEYCIHNYKKIKQISGYFKLGKKMCAIGLTNFHIFEYTDLLSSERKKDRIEKRYEDLLFTTEIDKCSYCDDFTLDSKTISKNNDTEFKIDRQTNKLGNFVQHLNDKHKFSFTKILNILKKFNY